MFESLCLYFNHVELTTKAFLIKQFFKIVKGSMFSFLHPDNIKTSKLFYRL